MKDGKHHCDIKSELKIRTRQCVTTAALAAKVGVMCAVEWVLEAVA